MYGEMCSFSRRNIRPSSTTHGLQMIAVSVVGGWHCCAVTDSKDCQARSHYVLPYNFQFTARYLILLKCGCYLEVLILQVDFVHHLWLNLVIHDML